MKCVIFLAILGFIAVDARSLPWNDGAVYYRETPVYVMRPRRNLGHRTMLVSGYYGPPKGIHRQGGYEPEGAMTAFASGDAAEVDSYLGTSYNTDCRGCPGYVQVPVADAESELVEDDSVNEVVKHDEEDVQEPEHVDLSEEDVPSSASPNADSTSTAVATAEEAPAEEPVEAEEDVVTVKPKSPKRTAKKQRKPTALPTNKDDDDDDEDDEDASWPIQKGSKRPSGAVPGYNTFFPIMFGGGFPGSGFRGGESGSNPGSAIAIANSFSTGKTGVAHSRATAYGSPEYRTIKRSSKPEIESESE